MRHLEPEVSARPKPGGEVPDSWCHLVLQACETLPAVIARGPHRASEGSAGLRLTPRWTMGLRSTNSIEHVRGLSETATFGVQPSSRNCRTRRRSRSKRNGQAPPYAKVNGIPGYPFRVNPPPDDTQQGHPESLRKAGTPRRTIRNRPPGAQNKNTAAMI